MIFQLLNALLAMWLAAAPGVLGYSGPAEVNDQIVGPLAAACAVTAAHEVMRPLRWVNVPLGLWLIIAPWVLHAGWPAVLNTSLVGALLCLLALGRGSIRHPYVGGWSVLWTAAGVQRVGTSP